MHHGADHGSVARQNSGVRNSLLITGADGQLGRDVATVATAAGWQVTARNRSALDITNAADVAAAVAAIGPTVIVNCAAWTAVDDCEGDPDRAVAVNGTAVAHIVSAADAVGAHVIQISTDYVFSGRGRLGEWTELDAPDPQTAYGRSKLVGEQAAVNHTVVRTSWLSGEYGPNIVKTILRLGAGDNNLSFVTDQRGKPTFTADLSRVVLELAAARPGGIFHATNARAVSWFEFAREVMAAGGFDPDRVKPILTADQQPLRAAVRPENSALANDALASGGFGPPLRDFAEPLAELVAVIQCS